VALLQRLHEAVAGRMELALDANCRLSEPDALVVGRALEEMGWAWFEEPTPRDPEVWARINRATTVPVSGCEPFTTLAQFAPYLEQRAVSIIQPDAGVCGISFAHDLGKRAHSLGIGLIPHNWHNGLMTMANAQLVAALPAPRLVELNVVQGPLQWEILRERPAIRDGYLLLPDRPGLGVELADDLEVRFPYIEGSWAAPVER
jgi:L-alanine-DL-glutamate epimerase-like enolase superfamily enzyme